MGAAVARDDAAATVIDWIGLLDRVERANDPPIGCKKAKPMSAKAAPSISTAL